MAELTELVEKFKRQGYKMTPQRRAIIQVLNGPESHLTAEQIHERVRADMPDTSLATVYNTLRELVSTDAVRELELGSNERPGKRRYELMQEQHAHFICVNCGRVEDSHIDWTALRPLLSIHNGFTPLRYEIVIQGYCTDCAPEAQNASTHPKIAPATVPGGENRPETGL